jgi:hypothetical protein
MAFRNRPHTVNAPRAGSKSSEPLVWGPFAAGGTLAAFLAPVLLVAIAVYTNASAGSVVSVWYLLRI